MTETELQRLVVRIVADTMQYQQGLKQVQSITQQAGQTLKKETQNVEVFGKSIDELGTKMGGFAGSMMAMAAIQSPMDVLKDSVKRAADAETLETAFTTVVGSVEKAQATLADLRKFAKDTPFEMPEIAEAAKMMIAMGTAAEDIVPTMLKLGDISAGLNIPIGQLAYLFGTLQSQGRAFTVDINQFAMRGVPIWGELEKIFGKTNAEVRKLVEEGKVGFADVNKAFDNMTKAGGKFGGGMDRLSKSFNGLTSTMNDDIGTLLITIGNNVMEVFHLKDAIAQVSVVAQQLNSALANMDPTLKVVVTSVIALTAASAALIVVWRVGAIGLGIIVGVLKDVVVTLKWIVPATWAYITALRSQTVAVTAATGGLNAMLGMTTLTTKTNWAGVAAATALKAALGIGIVVAVSEATFALAGGNKALREFNAEMERSKGLNDALATMKDQKRQNIFTMANALSGQDKIDYIKSQLEAANKEVADLGVALDMVNKFEGKAGEGLIDNPLFDAKDIPFFGEGLEKEYEMAQKNIKEVSDRLEAARKHAQALHKAMVDATKPATEDPEIIKGITDLNEKLAMQVGTWGMAAREADIYRMKVKGATEEQLLAAKQWDFLLTLLEAAKKDEEERNRAEEKRKTSITEIVTALQEEAATLGMSERQLKMRELDLLNVGDSERLAAEAALDAVEAFKVQNALFEEGKSLTEKYMTPLEVYNKEVGNLTTLLLTGAIGLDVYTAAMAEAKMKMDEASSSTRDARTELERLDAVLSGGAEAKFRIAAFRERNAVAAKPASVGSLTQGTVDVVKLLAQIALSTAITAERPAVEIEPAELEG